MSRIDVGDAVPDVELSTQGGEQIRLADYSGEKAAVPFFHPKDGSPNSNRWFTDDGNPFACRI